MIGGYFKHVLLCLDPVYVLQDHTQTQTTHIDTTLHRYM